MENDCAAPARVGNESFTAKARGLCSRNRLSAARGGGRMGFSRDTGGERILVSGARRMDNRNFSGISRAGREAKVSAGVARDGCNMVTQRIAPARIGLRTVPGAGAERSHVVKSAKPGKPPPAEPREARREGAGGAQRRATRSAAGRRDPPLDAKPARGNANFLRKISRGTRPARPAGGGANAFCFPSMGEPAPPRYNEHPARNTEFRGSSRRLFRDYLPDTKIRPPPDPREGND